jgi:hypothetical protein
MAAAAAVTFLLGAIIVPSGLAYRDFDGLSTDQLENLLSSIDYAGGDYRDTEPSASSDYSDYVQEGQANVGSNDYLYPMTEDGEEPSDYDQAVSIQQRQQEILSHGTPISSSGGVLFSTSGGTTKANPPKNSGAVLPAYCDPPNPCPIGYTDKDGCIEDFENTSDFSRNYQGRQNCLCDSEHMFNCPVPQDKSAGADPSFLAGFPPGLGSELENSNSLFGGEHKLVAKKGHGF